MQTQPHLHELSKKHLHSGVCVHVYVLCLYMHLCPCLSLLVAYDPMESVLGLTNAFLHSNCPVA